MPVKDILTRSADVHKQILNEFLTMMRPSALCHVKCKNTFQVRVTGLEEPGGWGGYGDYIGIAP